MNNGGSLVANALITNQRLRVLNLKNNSIDSDYFGKVLNCNSSLLSLDLSNNDYTL